MSDPTRVIEIEGWKLQHGVAFVVRLGEQVQYPVVSRALTSVDKRRTYVQGAEIPKTLIFHSDRLVPVLASTIPGGRYG